jgi:hypothetical protein
LDDRFNPNAPLANELLTFANKGPELIETNYWRGAQARRGQLFLSRNAGVYRLLVPEPMLAYLSEMRTGRSVTIEPSSARQGWWNVWFEDGTAQPWRLEMRPEDSMDFAPARHQSKLAVWTEGGKMFELPCEVVA